MNPSREQLEAMISAYLDDELDVEERAVVEHALKNDAAARALYADLQAMRQGLQSLPRARASSDMVEAIRARLERDALLGTAPRGSRGVERRLSSVTRWVSAASIVLLASAGGYVIWNLNRPETLPLAPQQLAVNERQAPAAPAAPSADFAYDGAPRDWAMRGRPEALELADAGRPEESEALTLTKGPEEPETPTITKGLGFDAPAEHTEDRRAAGGAGAVKERLKSDSDEAWLERQAAVPAGEETAPSSVAQEQYAHPLMATDGSLKRTEGRLGEPAMAPHPVQAGVSASGGAMVVTLTCNDAETRSALMDHVRSSAVLVRTFTPERQEAARLPARRGVAYTRNRELESERIAAREAEESHPVTRSLDDGDESAVPPAPAAAPARAATAERGVVRESAVPGEAHVTELLVVVPSEAVRQDMLSHLGVTEMALGDAVRQYGAFGRTTSRVQHFYAEPATAAESSPALPEDSFVFRPGREAGSAGRPEHAPDSRPAAAEGEWWADGHNLPRQDTAASGPATTTRLGTAAVAASGPSESPTLTEPPGYVVRLHITVRPPATAPETAGTPVQLRYDPSVLDLPAKPARAPATTHPATQDE